MGREKFALRLFRELLNPVANLDEAALIREVDGQRHRLQDLVGLLCRLQEGLGDDLSTPAVCRAGVVDTGPSCPLTLLPGSMKFHY